MRGRPYHYARSVLRCNRPWSHNGNLMLFCFKEWSRLPFSFRLFTSTIVFRARIAFFGGFSELVMDGHTDRHTVGRKDAASYRDARTHLKTAELKGWSLGWAGQLSIRRRHLRFYSFVWTKLFVYCLELWPSQNQTMGVAVFVKFSTKFPFELVAQINLFQFLFFCDKILFFFAWNGERGSIWENSFRLAWRKKSDWIFLGTQKLLNEQDRHKSGGGIFFLCHKDKGHDNPLSVSF